MCRNSRVPGLFTVAMLAGLVAPTTSLALNGDFNDDGNRDLAIGSPGEDLVAGGNDSDGAVSVLYGNPLAGAFTSSQFITEAAPGVRGAAEAVDQFGAELAQGDFNRDGHSDLAVAVPLEDVPEGADDRDGSVHLFYGAGGGLSTDGDRVLTQATPGLRGDDPELLDQFGSTLASGDFDGDRYSDLAIGVSDEGTAAGSRVGVVHVLYGGPRGLTTDGDQLWSQEKEGVAGDGAEPQDIFGRTLEVGDFNADGRDDLAVAVTLEDVASGANDNDGGVHVIDGSPDGLTTRGDQFLSQATAGVPGDGAQAGDVFGTALTAGDLDGDDHEDLVVGIPFESLAIGANDRDGAFNVLYGDNRGIGLTRNQFFTQETAGVPGAETAEAGDRFGFTLESGDFNGDRVADLAATALFEQIVGTGAGQNGAVHVLLGSEGGSPGAAGGIYLHQDVPGVEGMVESADRFGETLEAGDFTADARGDLVVGVPQENFALGGDDNDGVVQILRGSATGIVADADVLFSQGAPVSSDGIEAGDLFGDALP